MPIMSSLPKYAVLAIVVGGLGTWIWQLAAPGGSDAGAVGEVQMPELSQAALEGKDAFQGACADCHGARAAGTEKGPPLVHQIYNPGHHSDEAFFRAAVSGSPQHHWRFGDMPPQPEVSREEVAKIVRYVRELQRANGITTQPHRM
ncbi:MAG: cytochrome c [Tistlia sp.]